MVQGRDSIDPLSERLQRARDSPQDDYHLAIEVETLLRHTNRGGEDELEYVKSRLDNVEEVHPLFEAVEALYRWEYSGQQDSENGAKAAIDSFDATYERARNAGWNAVATLSLKWGIKLRAELSGFDPQDRLEVGMDFLEAEYRDTDIHLGQFSTILDLVIERSDSDDVLKIGVNLCAERAWLLHEQGDYPGERDYLRRLVEIDGKLGNDVTKWRQKIIKSIEAERAQKSGASALIRASVLETGLKECHGNLPEEIETEWRTRLRELNRKGIEEMPQIEHEIDADDFAFDVHQFVNAVEKTAKKTAPTEAFLTSLYLEYGYPDLEEARKIAEEHPISELLPRTTISPEGDSVGFRPAVSDKVDRVTSSYQMMLGYTNAVIIRALYQLIETRTIREVDFYLALETIPGITVHDKAFLTDAIIAFFERRYAEALHLLIPRIESVTVHVFEAHGEAVTKNVEEAIHQRNLGGLFVILEEEYDEGFGTYLQQRYTDTSGINLRNRVSHGQLRYTSADFGNTILVLYDLFRIAARISFKH